MSLKTFSGKRRSERTLGSAAGTSSAAAAGRAMPRHRGWLIAATTVVGVLLLIALVGSPIAKAIVNRKLAAMDGYTGQVGGLNLALWRGAVVLDDFVLRERGHEADPPILRIDKASLRVAPGALFKGKLGGAAVIDGAQLTIIKRQQVGGPKEAAEKAGEKVRDAKQQAQHWQDVLRNSFPVTLSRLELKRAQLRFIDRSHQPVADVGIKDLHIVATDLQNRPKANGDPMPANVRVDGVTTGNGKLQWTIQLDPVARQPRFASRFELRGLSLPAMNNFLQAYANADVSKGTFEVYMEIEAQGGAYNGYVKPLFHDLDFRTASDENKNVAEKIKEKVVSAVVSVLKNDDRQQVATKAPFRGNFADNQVDIWTTITELFHNAFVQALRGGFEGQTPRR